MNIYIGSDHGGYLKKTYLLDKLKQKGFEVQDCGSYNSDSTDYPDYALAVCRAIMEKEKEGVYALGILICRSGEGMDMAANKINGIRAALVWNKAIAIETRRDNNANVLVLAADYINDEQAWEITDAFLNTFFSGEERHLRRLEKLKAIEKANHAI